MESGPTSSHHQNTAHFLRSRTFASLWKGVDGSAGISTQVTNAEKPSETLYLNCFRKKERADRKQQLDGAGKMTIL